jgi:hypothetical protein
MPFWRAVLGYRYRGDSPEEDLIDPRGRGPSLWFQKMDAPRPQRNRIHIDVWVPHDQAEARVAAAITAGHCSRRGWGRSSPRPATSRWQSVATSRTRIACDT